MVPRDFEDSVKPGRLIVEIGNELKGLAAAFHEILSILHPDLVNRLQAIGDERGSDHGDLLVATFQLFL